MSTSVEIELTFLASKLPENLELLKCKRLKDVYFPASAEHPTLRIRQLGDTFELTKKVSLDDNDAGIQQETTIELQGDEFESLAAGNGLEVTKTRYYLPYGEVMAEIDVFEGKLQGLVLVDFEFSSAEQKQPFVQPDFCLADVTQEEFLAGGKLAGKSYTDIEDNLSRFNYKPIGQ